ncbi:fibronectin type III domain-containing protein [Dactylosporangium cerinum]|uniref:Fibronectin type III domain-containing protein n=1 Tax=Dactylosporangium cerinum TaxID=1434730 RepID=A0ABV9VU38_9ACTN
MKCRSILGAAPTDTRVTAVGDTTVSLTWTDRATAENGYRVDVSAPGNPSRSINLPADTSTHTVTGLDPLTAYTFLVRPVQDNAANIEDAQAGRATATTTGAIVIKSFTANPTQVTACQAVDVKLTYSVAGANRVKVERVVGATVTTVFDQPHGLEQWDNTVSGGSNDGGVNYVITAYGPDNTSVRKTFTVGRSSQNLMANTILFYNNSNSVMNVGFYNASGTVLITDLGQVAAKQYKRIQLPSCQKVLVGVKAPFVQDWIYLQTWLGHTAEGEKTAELHNYPTP